MLFINPSDQQSIKRAATHQVISNPSSDQQFKVISS
jgi:hypothetical protein